MSYIRPCKKCGQRISMREMRAGQWVAFDASTEKPHICGKKNKEDPNIKKTAEQKTKKESESFGLSYSDLDSENTSTETNVLSSQIEEGYTESLNTPQKVDDRYKKEIIHTFTQETSEIKKGGLEEEKEKTFVPEEKPLWGAPGTLSYYLWRGIVIFWIVMGLISLFR